MFNTIKRAVGWANPISKLINHGVPFLKHKVREHYGKQDEDLIKQSGNKFVVDQEAGEKYYEEKYKSQEKLQQELTTIQKEIQERRNQLKVRETKERNRLEVIISEQELQLEILKKKLEKEKASLDEFKSALGYSLEFEGMDITLSNITSYRERLEKLKAENNSQNEEEIRNLESAIDTFDYIAVNKLINAKAKFELDQVRISKNAMDSLYLVMRDSIRAKFERASKEGKIFNIKIPAYMRGTQKIINNYKLEIEDAEAVWEFFEKNILKDTPEISFNKYEEIFLPKDFNEKQLEALKYLFSKKDEYINKQGVMTDTIRSEDFDYTSNYWLEFYMEQEIDRLLTSEDTDDLNYHVAKEYEALKTKLEGLYRTLYQLSTEDGELFGLIQDEEARDHFKKQVEHLMETKDKGLIKKALEGVPKLFEYLNGNEFNNKIVQEIIMNMRYGISEPMEKHTVKNMREVLVSENAKLNKLLEKRLKEIDRIRNIVTKLNDSGKADKEFIESFENYIEYLETGDELLLTEAETHLPSKDILTVQDSIHNLKNNIKLIEEAIDSLEEEAQENIPLKEEGFIKITPVEINNNLETIFQRGEKLAKISGIEKTYNSEDFRLGRSLHQTIWEKLARTPGKFYIDEGSSKELKTKIIESLKSHLENRESIPSQNLRTLSRLETLFEEVSPKDIIDINYALNRWLDNYKELTREGSTVLAGLPAQEETLAEYLVNTVNENAPQSSDFVQLFLKKDRVENISDIDVLLVEEFLNLTEGLQEELEEQYLKVMESSDKGSTVKNVIKEFLNSEIHIQGTVTEGENIVYDQPQTLSLYEFIIEYGTEEDFRDLRRILTKTYGMDTIPLDISKEELIEKVNTTHIRELEYDRDYKVMLPKKYTNEFNQINNIRRCIARSFEGTSMNNNIPLLEVISNPDTLDIISDLNQILNGNQTLSGKNSYLNFMVNTSVGELEYMSGEKGFKNQLRNMAFKANFINDIVSSLSLNEAGQLKLMDFIDQISNLNLFKINADETQMIMSNNSYIDSELKRHAKRFDFPEEIVNSVVNKIHSIRKDILDKGSKSLYYNTSLKQSYDKNFVDRVKDTLTNYRNVLKEIAESDNTLSQQDVKLSSNSPISREEIADFTFKISTEGQSGEAGEALHIFKEKTLQISNLIKDLNGPLNRQAARNDHLRNHLMTQEAYNKNILQQPLKYSIDEDKFLEHNPGKEHVLEKLKDKQFLGKEDLEALDSDLKNVKEWLIDERVNTRTLVQNSSAISVRRSRETREMANRKSIFNIYYNNENISLFTSDSKLRTSTTTGMGYLIGNIMDVIREYTPLRTGQDQSDPALNDGLGYRFDMSVLNLFGRSLNYFNNKRPTDPELYGALKYYDEVLKDLIPPEALRLLQHPSRPGIDPLSEQPTYDNLVTLEEDLVKASLARTHMMQNVATLRDPELKEETLDITSKEQKEIETYDKLYDRLSGEYYNVLEEFEAQKEKISLIEEEIRKIGGGFRTLDKVNYKGDEFSVAAGVYTILDNKLPQGELENYAKEVFDYELTEEDYKEIERRKQVRERLETEDLSEEEIKELKDSLKTDFKNPIPLEITAYQLAQRKVVVGKIAEMRKTLEENMNKLIEEADTEEEKKQLTIEKFTKLKELSEESLLASNIKLEYGYEYISVWEDGTINEARKELAELNKQVKEEQEALKVEQAERIAEAKLRHRTNNVEVVKLQELQTNIMDYLHLGNIDQLKDTLNERYPGMPEFINRKVDELYKKYNEKKVEIGRRYKRTDFEKVTIDGVEISVPKAHITNGLSPALVTKILEDRFVPDSIKERLIKGDVDSTIFDNLEHYEKVYVEETRDQTHLERYKELTGIEDDSFDDFFKTIDEGYNRAVENIQYELSEELFDLIITMEDSMWNFGAVEYSPEVKTYMSEITRSQQLSNYFNTEFSNIIDLYTNENGVIDYNAILTQFVNNPHYKVVGIVKADEKDRPRAYRQDGEEVASGEGAPVVKELSIQTKEDIEFIIEQIEEGFQVGFMTENNFNTATRISYEPYRLPKWADRMYNLFVKSHKTSAILSAGFAPQVNRY